MHLSVTKSFTAKFVVSRFEGFFEFFCSVNRKSDGWVNANRNVTCSPGLAEIMTLDCSRIAKEIAIVSGFFVEGKEADVALFL